MRKEGPYVLKYPYFASGVPHELKINCDVLGSVVVGSDPADIQMRSRGPLGIDLASAANEFWSHIRPLLSTTVTCLTYELFKVNPTNSKHSFVSGGDLTAPNGSAGGPINPAWEGIFTFRTGAAGIMKIVVLDVFHTSNYVAPLGSVDPSASLLKTYILGDNNIAQGRDRSFPVAGLNEAFGQNEQQSTRRFR